MRLSDDRLRRGLQFPNLKCSAVEDCRSLDLPSRILCFYSGWTFLALWQRINVLGYASQLVEYFALSLSMLCRISILSLTSSLACYY